MKFATSDLRSSRCPGSRRRDRKLMSTLPDYMLAAHSPSRLWTTISRSAISVVGVCADASIIITGSILGGAIYQEAAYGTLGPLLDFLKIGCVAAVTFVLLS